MTKADFPSELAEKPQRQDRCEDAVPPHFIFGHLSSCAFHRGAQLVQARAEDYSVSPKISAVSRRNPWPL
jgi:hypothetical protein